MATTIIRPTGESQAQWTNIGAGTNWQCVDEAGQDPLGDQNSTYVRYLATDGARQDRYTTTGHAGFDDLAVGSTITNVSLRMSYRASVGSGRVRYGIYNGSSDNIINADSTLSWTEYNREFAVNPFTSLAWTKPVLQTMQFSLRNGLVSIGTQLRVTLFRFVVTYTPPPTPKFEYPFWYMTS